MAQNLKSMKVSEVMTRSVVCTCPNTSAHDILKKLNSSNISGMLVVEDNTVIGLVSGSDILQLSIQGEKPEIPPVTGVHDPKCYHCGTGFRSAIRNESFNR